MDNDRALTIDFQKITARFFEDTSLTSDKEPELVLIMGGVGAGKSTLRKDKFTKGYVVLDAGEIYSFCIEEEYHEFDVVKDLIEIIGGWIAEKSIKEKRSIVVEMIGDSKEDIEALITAMRSVGYKLKLQFVSCDPAEAYRRHLKAVEDDKSYISCYFTQKSHLKWLLEGVKAVGV